MEVEREDAYWERYSRNILLPEIGVDGQLKISRARVLIIGAGGLGSPAAYYLAAAGVGVLGLADADDVDLSNLQRQILHATADVGSAKVLSAAAKIRAINPDVEVVAYRQYLDAATIGPIVADYDFVIEGVDNFPSKFLINDACVLAGVPFSQGGILQFVGMTMTVKPGDTACYRCVMGEPPTGTVPTCSSAGVFGAIAGMLGSIQAAEALKYITGAGRPLYDSLLCFDAKAMDFMKSPVQRNPRCRVCGEQPDITALAGDNTRSCVPGGDRACRRAAGANRSAQD
ncbi:Sulfur carrier protein adenylyltransferase ThiF [Desulfovibrio sp. DV]|uniref:HesA/MoeB/ThiF family protein n=1 Tax=Desulfovibrio sp. DV TaxID=1844708 RepID=UPI00095E798F|nr:HesA/MoeB/ThiF family protein [Desulfovibrio sp. DV]OLN30710.1 Sulfur carrier protein adenylyltransferase ThiF [Desulfovibrio sp. DV]